MGKKVVLAPGAPFPKQTPLQLSCFQDSRYTWTGIFQEQPDGSLQHLAHGSAILDPTDTFDYQTGLLLATGRALVNLGNQYLKRGNGLVKMHDDIKVEREWRQVQTEAVPDFISEVPGPFSDDAIRQMYSTITSTPSGRAKGGHWEGSDGHRTFVENACQD